MAARGGETGRGWIEGTGQRMPTYSGVAQLVEHPAREGRSVVSSNLTPGIVGPPGLLMGDGSQARLTLWGEHAIGYRQNWETLWVVDDPWPAPPRQVDLVAVPV